MYKIEMEDGKRLPKKAMGMTVPPRLASSFARRDCYGGDSTRFGGMSLVEVNDRGRIFSKLGGIDPLSIADRKAFPMYPVL